MSVFLRGPRVDVLAPDAADPGFGTARRAWLLPERPFTDDVEADGDVCLVWAPAHGGPTAGSFALDAIDWPAGRALLVAALAPGADAALAHEALGLVVGYAATELGLERIEARLRADDRATRETLAALGFAEEGRLTAGWRDPEPVDVALMARIRRVGNG